MRWIWPAVKLEIVSTLISMHFICVWCIWCIFPPIHCLEADMRMILLAVCSAFCRILWMFLKQNCWVCLILFSWVISTLKIKILHARISCYDNLHTKKELIIQREHACTNDFQWFARYVMMNESLFGLCLLKLRHFKQFFIVFWISVFILTQ